MKVHARLFNLTREIFFFLRACMFAGKRFTCPLCGFNFRKMLLSGVEIRANARCPRCNSLERHRAIWLFLQRQTDLFTKDRAALLHFAPEFCLGRRLNKNAGLCYVSADISYSRAMVTLNLTALPLNDKTFDCFICIHVLEHIQNDILAMQEAFRVLKPGGWGIIQVPFGPGLHTTKDGSPDLTDAQRLNLFGQKDHVRLYGVDIIERLARAGFTAVLVNYAQKVTEMEIKQYSLSTDEPFIFVSRKN